MPDSQGYVRSGGDIHTDGHTSAGEREDHVRGAYGKGGDQREKLIGKRL